MSSVHVPPGLSTTASYAWRLLVVLAAALVLAYALLRLRLVVVPVVLAAAIAALLHPQVDWLDRHRLPRSLAALLVALGWTAALLGAFTAVGMTVADDVPRLADGVDGGLQRLRDYLAGLGVDALRLSQLQAQATDALRSNQRVLTTGVISGATLLAEVLAGFALFVVVLFFFLRDGRSMWRWVLARTAPAHRDDVDAGGRAAVATLAAYLRGTAVIATADAVLIGVALLVLGVPLVVPLAVLVFVGAFIPVVGSTIAGLVAVLVALVSEGPVTALLAGAAVVVVQQVEGDVLAPLVFGRALSLHPFVVLVTLTGGAVVGGVLGAAASVPLVAAGWAVVRAVRPSVSDDLAPQGEGAAGADPPT